MQFSELEDVLRSEAAYHPVAPHKSLATALTSFGLKAAPELLRELSAEEAEQVLWYLLSRGMAYGEERLPQEVAGPVAREFVVRHNSPSARFFSNGNLAAQQGWNPMTEHTFDSGVLVDDGHGAYACVWFVDED